MELEGMSGGKIWKLVLLLGTSWKGYWKGE
jgi:hypothetical protein